MMTLFRSTLLMMSLATLAACAPAKEDVQFSEAKHTFGPQRQDVDLGLTSEKPRTSALTWQAETSGAVFYRLNENLMGLYTLRAANSDALKAYINNWWAQRPTEKQSIANGAYASLLMDRAGASAKTALREALTRIDSEKNSLAQQLKNTKGPSLKPSTELGDQADAALAFFADFQKSVAAQDLQPTFKSSLLENLEAERVHLRAVIDKAIADLRRSRSSISKSLRVVEGLLKSEGITLESSSKRDLEEGRHLGRTVDAIQDEESALAALVEVWLYLSPKQRKTIFQPINAELYDYLSGQPEENLRCLQGANCTSIITYLAKNLFILPKIRDFGVEKIKTTIDSEGAEYVGEKVQKVAAEKIGKIGPLMADVLVDRINDKLKELRALDGDFEGDVRRRLAKWAGESPVGPLVAEKSLPARVKVNFESGNSKVEFIPQTKGDVESDGALAGLGAALTGGGWISEEASRRWFMAEFNRVAVTGAVAPTALARDHAEILRGLSLLSKPLRDYEKTSFEGLFSFANAQQLFPSIHAKELDQSLFPKDAIYALSLSKLGDYLKQIQTNSTPVFLLDLDNKVTWANEYDFEHSSSQAVMAGVVDRVSAGDTRVVRSANVSRYLLSLSEFLRSTASVEKSQSKYLREEQNGQIPMTQLQEARSKLKLLAVALGNYLSHQMRRPDGLIDASLALPSQKSRGEPASLADQALAMRALTDINEVLGVDLYRWEAMDVLAAMNKSLYRRELGFYADDANGSRRTSLPVVVETLRALAALEPHLPDNRRQQVRTIREAWMPRVTALFGN